MTAGRPYAVLFDLDGTLIDTVAFLLDCYRHAFRGRPRAPTEAEWVAGIGTPLAAQMRPYAASDAELQALIAGYRAYQREHHDRMTRPFADVVETLRRLRERGHRMAVVTSKGDDIALRSVRHVGLEPYLDTIVGCDSCRLHKPDPEPVRVALARLGASAGEALFVGDSPHDVAAGNAAGVVTVAALWGPFSRAQLEAARPRHYVERITDLPALLERLERGAEVSAPDT